MTIGMNFQIIDDCWTMEDPALAAKYNATLQELRTWLATQTNPVAVALTQDAKRTWRQAEMRAIERDIVAAFRPVRRAHAMFGCLHHVVQRWNEMTCKACPLPRIAFLHAKAKNPFKYDPAEALRLHAHCKFLLHEEIRNGANDAANGVTADAQDWLALSILSGVLNFGLLHRDLILAVVNALANPTRSFFSMGSQVALQLSLPVRGVPDSEHRVWTPDPLTATLLLRVDELEARAVLASVCISRISQQQQSRQLYAALAKRVARIFVAGDHARNVRFTLPGILRFSTHAARYWLPFSAVAYLTRKFISHSLRPQVLARLDASVQLLSLPETSAPISDDNRTGSARNRFAKSGPTSAIDEDRVTEQSVGVPPLWLPTLRQAMRGSTMRQIRSGLAGHIKRNDVPLISMRLAEFAHTLSQRRGRRSIKLSTLRTYIPLLAKYLGPYFNDDDPADLGRTGIESLYLEAMEDHACSSSGRSLSGQRRFARCILLFHRFLMEKHEARPLEELGGLGLGCLPVDANLLGEEGFLRVVQAVRAARSIPESQRLVAALLLVLGYRCGLRRNEAYYLRICDFILGNTAFLSVRETKERKLKSPNAQRKLNLTALVPSNEFQWLADFLRIRSAQGNVLDRLFTAESGTGKLLDEEELFAEIHRILRRELGDATLRFHSLRHSFATWTFLRLAASSSVFLQAALPNLKQASANINGGEEFRRALFESSGIRAIDLHAVADMLGHGSPKMSLEHYLHCFDLFVASLLMAQPSLSPPRLIVMSACGMPKTTAYRLAGTGLAAVPQALFRRRFKKEIAQLILLLFQDETNYAILSSWQDHE